jgi:hypothetical protein
MAKRESSGRNRSDENPCKDGYVFDRYINEDAEQLLGQMMFAVGQGADGVHIHRSAVAKMRERYEPSTYKFVICNPCRNSKGEKIPNCWEDRWKESGIYTLRYFEVIGRLAAHYATIDGTPSIDARHFEQARVVVEATYRAELAEVRIEGDICP